jgi:hypothetical protein
MCPREGDIAASDCFQPCRGRISLADLCGYCDHDLLKEFGDSRILQKPYTEGDLVDKIAAALN